MSDLQGIAKAFVDYYYQTFDRNRMELAPLYRPQSMLTFEGNMFQGSQAIVEKLQALPFQKVQHVKIILTAASCYDWFVIYEVTYFRYSAIQPFIQLNHC